MIRKILFSIFLLINISFAQIEDSLISGKTLPADSLSFKPDSLVNRDSLSTIAKRDTLIPVYSEPLSEKSFLITKNELLKLEYRNTADYLRLFPLNFIKDLGTPGQPNETFLYGIGNGGINFLIDGVTYNDRFTNSLNLNLIQSEDIDSVEVVPLPRGFLYGAYNNPVSVNFITRDFLPIKPYTRIRFYQGSNRELLFDGSFNAKLMNRLTLSFAVTNRIADSTYKNTEFSIWQGKVKLKYFLSNSLNIIASYNYNDYRAGYNGGVNVDTIISSGKELNSLLYDFQLAPVVYPNGEVSSLSHLPRLRFIIKPADEITSDISFFYFYSDQRKFTNTFQYSENKIWGINFKNDYKADLFNAQLSADYETGRINLWEHKIVDSIKVFSELPYYDRDLFSIAGNISVPLFDGALIPSVFGKYSIYNNKSVPFLSDVLIGPYLDESINTFSVGFDLSYKASQSLAFYMGGSLPHFKDSDEAGTFEIGGKYFNDFMYLNLNFFGFGGYHNYGNLFFKDENVNNELFGSGLIFKFQYSFLLLESTSSFYFKWNGESLYNIPSFQTQTGLYYKSILFDDNLDLKTGFVFYFTGTNNVQTQERGVLAVGSSNKLDFTLTGEIQKSAIIYFNWQNLFGSEYYLTPYYPMPSRSIRFGVAWELFD